MKKKLSILSLLLVFTMTAMSQTPVNGIYYNLNDSENTAEVVSNNSDHYIYSGNIIIPSSISVNGVDYSVTSIGFQAFTGCSGLTSIKIPNSVTLIGKYAFYYCSGLTNIEIPNSVTLIEYNAFNGCSGLTSITMQSTTPPHITTHSIYASGIFSECSKLDTIYVPIGAADAYNVAPWKHFNIIESTPDVSEVTFNFKENPWGLPLSSGSGETAVAGNVEEITQDGVVLSLEQLSASTHPRMWTGPQLRVYKKNQLTVKAPAGKVVTKAVWTATGASYYGLTVNDEAVDATAGWSGAQAEVPFVVSVNGRYNTLVVTLANEESTSGIPENTLNYEPRHNGTKFRNDRTVTAVKLIGESSGEHVYTLTFAEQKKDYTDVTASVVFQVEPGERLTPNVEYPGIFMNHAVYIDTDKNGFTGAIAAGSEWKPAGDLVSYSFYNNGADDDSSGWNSVGEVISGDNRKNPPLPAFTAPTEPGIYRMRFVQDWCSIDPAGDADGKFGDFKENGGQIVDVTLVVGDFHINLTDGEDYTNTIKRKIDFITYTREFNNTQWQAWYVPFDIDYDAISDDFTAASLNAVHQYDDDEDGVFERWTLEILKLKSGEVLRANMPYMIRAKETGEHNFVVENAILYPAEENSLDCSSVRVNYTFKGNYSLMDGQVLRDNGWFAPGGGSLVTPTVGSNLKAYRWLLMPEARSGYGTFYAPKRINIVIGDEEGEVTGIEDVTLEEWPADVYDLNGRMVKAQAENLDELPKGVYIVNGKKFVK